MVNALVFSSLVRIRRYTGANQRGEVSHRVYSDIALFNQLDEKTEIIYDIDVGLTI
jgi:hypothetical protein